jgi:hypothetical protein
MQKATNIRRIHMGKQYKPVIKRKRAKKRIKRQKAALKAKLAAK